MSKTDKIAPYIIYPMVLIFIITIFIMMFKIVSDDIDYRNEVVYTPESKIGTIKTLHKSNRVTFVELNDAMIINVEGYYYDKARQGDDIYVMNKVTTKTIHQYYCVNNKCNRPTQKHTKYHKNDSKTKVISKEVGVLVDIKQTGYISRRRHHEPGKTLLYLDNGKKIHLKEIYSRIRIGSPVIQEAVIYKEGDVNRLKYYYCINGQCLST